MRKFFQTLLVITLLAIAASIPYVIVNRPVERKFEPLRIEDVKNMIVTNGKVLIVCSKDKQFAVVVFLDTLMTSPSENGCAQDQ